MSNNSSIYTLKSHYIPNSKCFGPDIIPCKGSCMYPKRKRAVAKFKQQFTPSDENLSTELKEREKNYYRHKKTTLLISSKTIQDDISIT